MNHPQTKHKTTEIITAVTRGKLERLKNFLPTTFLSCQLKKRKKKLRIN